MIMKPMDKLRTIAFLAYALIGATMALLIYTLLQVLFGHLAIRIILVS